VNEAYETGLTLGQRLADRIAEFGGSGGYRHLRSGAGGLESSSTP
jgi:uncharacterized membrane protein